MTEEGRTSLEQALSLAQLPESLEGWRVLAIGDGAKAHLESLGAAEVSVIDEPSEKVETGEAFDLAVYDREVAPGVHPLAVYTWLRQAVKADGILVAGSRVLRDPNLTRYVRFPLDRPSREARSWVPGRLSFRWMVEVSGFELVAWLGIGEEDWSSGRAYLQARAVDREPALDLQRQPLGR